MTMLRDIPIIPADVAVRLAGWQFVGATWQSGHPSCEECQHNDPGLQSAPFGEGVAWKADPECRLGNRLSDKPEQCPVYAAHLDECATRPTDSSST